MQLTALRRPYFAAVVVAAALALSGCGHDAAPTAAPADRSRPVGTQSDQPVARAAAVPSPSLAAGRTYVAVGASETVGVGADHPRTEAWPRVLHDSALNGSTFVNLGVSGATVGEALAVQLPVALAAQPDVVTVWLAVNDLTHLVPVSAYEQQLRTLVHELRRDGRTTVLVGNMPPVDRMPAYLACLPGAVATDVTCQLPIVPPPVVVRELVASYNAAIARVVQAEAAVPVDLSQGRDLTRLTSGDGFHPSTAGHRMVAAAFARALSRSAH
jgi:lysophospholipase L1-like esterase